MIKIAEKNKQYAILSRTEKCAVVDYYAEVSSPKDVQATT